ncbi:hypothetical protein [Stenotrophomonas maltophilia]|uniref:hypothetical protein n=1 Tax=Stenotrophomonas maltophilia TaxID=40324 RepID=UPI00066D2E97|nr:hypothetical protein [Stenotrophomonas maltophilia]
MTSLTMSDFRAIGSISTPSETPHPICGQLYEIARNVRCPKGTLALTSPIVAVVKLFLQCGHTLMGSLSLAGCGLAFASYREGEPAFDLAP